jgi:hypothetical protein
MSAKLAIAAALLLAVCGAGAAEDPAMPAPELRSLDPPVLLPDGREFRTWRPALTFTKTYYVDGSAPNASDDNPGTQARPFRTIDRAAQVLRPGERVVVAAGVYREWVRPRRGGTSPAAMISYQAAPGAEVVVKGSRGVPHKWQRSGKAPGVWKLKLAAAYFEHGYNPFAVPNITPKQFDGMSWAHRWRGHKPYTLPRGLVFQDGRRLRQVGTRQALAKNEGACFVDPDGPTLHVHLAGGKSPNDCTMEITTQQGIFAPERIGLGYIHVKGFTFEHAGNAFPMPQYGAVSTTRGHHWLIEGNTVRQVNGVGIDVGTQYWALPQPKTRPGWHVVRRNTVTDCGVCGIQGLSCRHSLIENNLLARNAFHPVEQYYETGGIKTHGNDHTLIRRNRILDTLHGGGIWMDFANVNSRCCRNVIVGSRTIHGAIFIEASQKPNMVDRNVIWDTRGVGIYEHDCSGQIFCHNFVGRCSGAGLWLRGKVTDRKVHGQPIRSGENTAVNNVLFETKGKVRTTHEQRDLSGNVDKGIDATFDRKTLTLTWRAPGDLPACPVLKTVTHDFFGRAWPKRRPPGPFARAPKTPTAVRLHRGK